MRGFRNILFLLFVLLAFCACGRKARVISKGDLVDILADMYVADQLVSQNSELRGIADTSFVYEPIFRKYGYSTEDYHATERYYMRDPNRYSRIVRKVIARLEKQTEVLRRQESIEQGILEKQELVTRHSLHDRPGFFFADSLIFARDTLRQDTVYSGPAVIIDTLAAPADSTAAGDTIVFKVPMLEDSDNLLKPVDNLKRKTDLKKRAQ